MKTLPTNPIAPVRPTRRVLAATIAAAVGLSLAGCATATPAVTTSAASTPTAAATQSASSSDIVGLAEAFAATLTDDQKSALYQDYSLANAAKWSNLPQALLRGGEARIGLQLSTLSDEQRTALNALIQAATGTTAGEGFDEIQQLLNADDYLAASGGGSDYGSGNYFVAFLGTPSDSGTWELQYGGHHFALANTYIDGALAGATPSFRGVEPSTAFDQNGVTNQPLAEEIAALSAMLGSLSADQLAAAQLDGVYSDLVLGPSDDWAFPATQEGVSVSTLSADQKALVLAAINTYVDDLPEADAAAILAKYESELDATTVSYSGSTTLTNRDDYVRIDGPSVWIELSVQGGIVLQGTHPHSVWRDKTNDYGGTTA